MATNWLRQGDAVVLAVNRSTPAWLIGTGAGSSGGKRRTKGGAGAGSVPGTKEVPAPGPSPGQRRCRRRVRPRDKGGAGAGSSGAKRGTMEGMAQLRIALAQVDTTVGDLAGNAETVLRWSRAAVEAE